MKIHIIGVSGSGKSYFAEQLSKEYGIPHYDLDHVMWDNRSDSYGVKRSPEERNQILQEILKEPNWIIEGVYYAWCQQCFDEADQIYVLNVPRYKYKYRIIRRFIRRKLGIEQGKKETIQSLVALLNWADKYQRENMVEIHQILSRYPDKIIER